VERIEILDQHGPGAIDGISQRVNEPREVLHRGLDCRTPAGIREPRAELGHDIFPQRDERGDGVGPAAKRRFFLP